MPRAAKVCSRSGCTAVVPRGTSRCPDCERAADRARGTSAERGYQSKSYKAFRAALLARSPICEVCHSAWATISDHYPLSRKERIEQGLPPDDPAGGRSCCLSCHQRETQKNPATRGGWYADQTQP